MTSGLSAVRTERPPLSWLASAIPLVAVSCSVLPLLFLDYPKGHDWPFELVRLTEYRHAVASGQWPPYWAENLYGGFGSPVFLFYAPLFNAVSSTFMLIGDAPAAAALTLILATAVSAWAVRRMLLHTGLEGDQSVKAGARVAIVIFVLSPYLLGDKLIRNANAEFLALCLLPLVLAGIFTADRHPRRTVICLGIALAAIVLAHNLTALVAAVIAVVFALAVYVTPDCRRIPWLPLASAALLGMGLSAFFWIPATSLSAWMRTDELLAGKFDFHHQFTTLGEVFGHGPFFSLGPVPILVWLVGTAALFRARGWRGRRPLVAGLVVMPFLTYMMLPGSVFVWEAVPLLPLFQFPWRLAGPLALMTALVAGLSFGMLTRSIRPEHRLLLEAIVLGACLANAFPILSAHTPLGAEERAWVTRMSDPEILQRNPFSATVQDEYLPVGADISTQLIQSRPVLAVDGSMQFEVLHQDSRNLVLNIQAEKPGRLVLARWYFPGWQIHAARKEIELRRHASGAVEIALPSGASRLHVRLAPPLERIFGLAVSYVALFILLGLIWHESRSRRKAA